MHLLHLMHDVPLWVTALAVSTAAGLYSIGLMLGGPHGLWRRAFEAQ